MGVFESAKSVVDPFGVTDRMGRVALSASAWVLPSSYRRECLRLQARDSDDERQREADMVRGLGVMVLVGRRDYLPVVEQDVRAVVEGIRPALGETTYSDVFDPHTASVLQGLAPLQPAVERYAP